MKNATAALVVLPLWLVSTAFAGGKPTRDELLQQARTGSCKAREHAVLRLVDDKQADPDVAKLLRESLTAKDRCTDLWFSAGEYFEAHPEPSLYEPLHTALQASLPEPRDVAHNLARALGATRDPRAFAELNGILENAKLHPFARAGAAVGLARTGDAKAIPVLEKLITSEDRAAYGAIEGLGVAKSRQSLPLLEELLDQPAHTDEAARALGAIGDAAAAPKLLSYLFIPDPQTRHELVEALAHFDSPNIRATLRFMACFDGNESVRYAAGKFLKAKQLTATCDTSLMGRLRNRIYGSVPSFDHRSTITPANAGKIEAALTDAEPTVRLLAANALAALHQASSVPALTDALAKESDPGVKKALERAIKHAQAGEAGFLARLHDQNSMVRGAATYQLIATDFPNRDTLLLGQLDDSEGAVRWEVEEAAALGEDPICTKKNAPRFAAVLARATDEREKLELQELVKLCDR